MTLTLQNDTVSPALAMMQSQVRNPRGIVAAAGRSVTNLFKTHLRYLQKTRPNKLGGQRTNFWNQLAQSVNFATMTTTTGVVSISDPRAAHKHKGGILSPKHGNYLTIPVAPEAHGRRASVLEAGYGIKLFFFARKNGPPLLVGQLPEGQGIKVYYVLKRSVYQEPDPQEGILPPDTQIQTAALTAASAAFKRQMQPKV
jgi:hypothetical protein